jgi:Rv2525c-like, glycoside hydrolase-like domain
VVEGVDYSGARPSGICMYANGKRFAVRYFGPGGSWKLATRAECAGLWASGIDLVAVAEGFANDAMQGYGLGRQHAIAANAHAVASGMPINRPVYFAVDFDMQLGHANAVGAYLDGAASHLGRGRTGIYGGYTAIQWAGANGKAAWFWQTYAWSQGRWSGYNHIEQYRNHVTVCGGQVDLCRSKRPDYGQWHPPSQSVGSAPAAPHPSQVDTPWEFMDLLGQLGNQVLDVATTMGDAAKYIDGLR